MTPRDPTRIVLDTNVVLWAAVPAALVGPENAAVAAAAFSVVDGALELGVEICAPPLMLSEAANVVSRDYVAGGVTDLAGGKGILAALERLPDRLVLPDWGRVLDLQAQLQRTRSTADAEFLAVAEALGCGLVTADARLADNVRQRGITVRVVHVLDHPWARGGVEDDVSDASEENR